MRTTTANARRVWTGAWACLLLASPAYAQTPSATPTPAPTPTSAAPTAATPTPVAGAASDELSEILVQADEPRFVSPTRRDRIGRIWAPVFINDRGPYRLVLDTGASHSAVIARVAQELKIPFDPTKSVMLRGVTGSATVPVIRVDRLKVGDLLIEPVILPIVTDAMGGAEGILGTEGLDDMRIFIDFKHDRIHISRSRGERAPYGFITVPLKFLRGRLLIVDASVGDQRAAGCNRIPSTMKSSVPRPMCSREIPRIHRRFSWARSRSAGRASPTGICTSSSIGI
jgi:hypothetical protein